MIVIYLLTDKDDYGYYKGSCYSVNKMHFPVVTKNEKDPEIKAYKTLKMAEKSLEKLKEKCFYVSSKSFVKEIDNVISETKESNFNLNKKDEIKQKTEKYAIYKRENGGLYAASYVDTEEGLKHYPYIKKDRLPVIINRMGGFSSFILKYEIEDGFLEIKEVLEDEEPLTVEEMYPMNLSSFDYGWIDPEGNTYSTPKEGHRISAEFLCLSLNIKSHRHEDDLMALGWAKVTFSNFSKCKEIFSKNNILTKKQFDIILELELEKDSVEIRRMIKFNENKF